MKEQKVNNRVKGLFFGGVWGATGFFIFICGWWFISYLIGQHRLPTPPQVAIRTVEMIFYTPRIAAWGGPRNILPHMQSTIIKYAIGTLTGVVLGIGVGLLMKYSDTIYEILVLPVEGIRTIPALAFSPFFLLWFGATPTAAILLLIVYSSLMLVINTINAIENVPSIYSQFAQTLGATRGQIFRTVIIPAIIPELIGGIRVTLTRSWGLIIVAELLGTPLGMGKVFTQLTPYFAIASIIGGILWIIGLANLTDRVFLLVANRVTRWM